MKKTTQIVFTPLYYGAFSRVTNFIKEGNQEL